MTGVMPSDFPLSLNRLKSLHGIDHHLLPELTDEQWARFRDDPVRFFLRADDPTQAAIWREIERRQRT
jgi:hypothetical protein